MAMVQEIRKPLIHFYHAPQTDRRLLREVELGMEEEGIPWKLSQEEGGHALELAWEAAKSSNLEVGIGADGQELVLHYNKLEMAQPLFRISAQAGAAQARALGANAARLVKKLPLKALDGR
ncbi:MAG TPA: glycerol dehydratase reactivase beta/small subunit family protein [Candidatus Flavonifractor merdavium]|nr:glycerol dehydratase reactivase beta/small subunit family protein [Candidatus Flavonifractor merdavium]